MKINTQTRRDVKEIKLAWAEFTHDMKTDPLAKLGMAIMALIVAFFMLMPWLTD